MSVSWQHVCYKYYHELSSRVKQWDTVSKSTQIKELNKYSLPYILINFSLFPTKQQLTNNQIMVFMFNKDPSNFNNADAGDEAKDWHLRNWFDLKGAQQRGTRHLRHHLTSSRVPVPYEGWHLLKASMPFLSSPCIPDSRKLPRKPVVCFFCICVRLPQCVWTSS